MSTTSSELWNIAQCGAWIDARNMQKVDRASPHLPSDEAIKQLNGAWRAGRIVATGEVDGEPRRLLNAADATYFSIVIARWTSKFQRPFDSSPESNTSGILLVQSNRYYPLGSVRDRCGTPIGLGRSGQLHRRRFIKGMLFDRNAVIEKWPGDRRQEVAASAIEKRNNEQLPRKFLKNKFYSQFLTIAFDRSLDLSDYYANPSEFWQIISTEWPNYAKDDSQKFTPLSVEGGELDRRLEQMRSASKRFLKSAEDLRICNIQTRPIS